MQNFPQKYETYKLASKHIYIVCQHQLLCVDWLKECLTQTVG